MTTLSVIVCTRNRADLLDEALQSLVEQTLEPSHYEVLVVDNNSTDNTAGIVKKYGALYPNIRYCLETEQGLSNARNRGWKSSQSAYVAFVDDDCLFPKTWLAMAKEMIDRMSPGVFGGPYSAFYKTAKPSWFRDSYGSHVQGDEFRELEANEYLDGGNIFFRRALLEAMGGFNAGLGMSGGKLAYGEETALLRRIRAEMPGEKIYYDPELLLFHLVSPEKMTLKWRMRQSFADGRYSHIVFDAGKPARGLLSILARMAHALSALSFETVKAFTWRDRNQYPYIQNYLCEQVFLQVSRLGNYAQQLKEKFMRQQTDQREQDPADVRNLRSY